MGQPERIQFFVTNAHDCSYLENRQATALFADPYSTMTSETFGALMEIGFRRSGDYIYKPRCNSCQACIPVRVPARTFTRSRSQKRIWKKNQHLQVHIESPAFREEDYALYETYINTKHQDGGMHPPTVDQYESFLFCQWSNSSFIRFFEGQQLVCIAVMDQIPNGLSAVYTFYHPDFSHLSLGTYSVLWQMDFCLKHSIQHLYLGYWIKECKKMSYKNQYAPYELFMNEQWKLHEASTPIRSAPR